jgi:hypothetical protein
MMRADASMMKRKEERLCGLRCEKLTSKELANAQPLSAWKDHPGVAHEEVESLVS